MKLPLKGSKLLNPSFNQQTEISAIVSTTKRVLGPIACKISAGSCKVPDSLPSTIKDIAIASKQWIAVQL